MENKHRPENTFLIVNGAQIYPLEKETIAIGRSADNDLVINDQRISRKHARLDAQNGKYILTDLNSRGGTSVNGNRASRQEITPGDVISLAGIPLIYGQYGAGSKFGDFAAGRPAIIRSDHPTVAATESQDIEAIDRYLDLFDDQEGK